MKYYKGYWRIIVFLSFLAFYSCENDIEVIKSLSDPAKAPDVSLTNVETIYSDSGRVKVRMVAPVSNIYEDEQKKYDEFPKGIHVYFYNDSTNVNAEVSAKYAIYHEKKQLWEANNDVVVINTKGEKMNTEQLFWDRNKRIIYTKKYCRITTPDGLQHIGEGGMEADENFDNWRLIGANGTFSVKDEGQ